MKPLSLPLGLDIGQRLVQSNFENHQTYKRYQALRFLYAPLARGVFQPCSYIKQPNR